MRGGDGGWVGGEVGMAGGRVGRWWVRGGGVWWWGAARDGWIWEWKIDNWKIHDVMTEGHLGAFLGTPFFVLFINKSY
jgi:hypothetical protein